MPTYEYRCNACEHAFERFQSIKARPVKKCPECGKLKVERLISGGGAVLFKGSGFYETDYRSASYQKAAEAEKKSSESKANGTSDGKGGGEGASKHEKPAETKKPAVQAHPKQAHPKQAKKKSAGSKAASGSA